MKKLFISLLFLLSSIYGVSAQDFNFTRNELEASYMFVGSVNITGDSLTADVQGYLDGFAKDFDAGSIGIFTGSTPTEVAVTLSKNVHQVRFSVQDSLTTKYSNYIDISAFATVKMFAKLVNVSGNTYTAYLYITNGKGENMVTTPYRIMNK